jgi:hypothetical protein
VGAVAGWVCNRITSLDWASIVAALDQDAFSRMTIFWKLFPG